MLALVSRAVHLKCCNQITETCTRASRTYLSTLAVLQLDAILTNAKVVSTVRSKDNANQKPFEKIIIMKYDCVGIGVIKMTVGVRRRNHEKAKGMFTFWWGWGQGLCT